MFSVLFHFYSVFIILSLSCSLLIFPLSVFYCLIVFHHLSVALFFILFLAQAPSLPSLASGRFHLLPQASCVYISVIYFDKCQTAFLPSIQREKKMKDGQMGEWQQKSGVKRKEKWNRRQTKIRTKCGINLVIWMHSLYSLLPYAYRYFRQTLRILTQHGGNVIYGSNKENPSVCNPIYISWLSREPGISCVS